jgi:uncharacterized protein with PQ loop repeat
VKAVEVFGWLCGAVGLAAYLPQLLKLLRTRQAAGLSVLSWQSMLAGSIAWTNHGLMIGAANQAALNVVIGVPTAMIVAMICQVRRLRAVRVFGVAVLAGAAVAASDWLLGSAVFGVVVLLLGAGAIGGQTLELVRAPSLDGVAPTFLFGQLAFSCLWALWALWAGDIGTVIAFASNALVLAFNAAWWVHRTVGRTGARLRPGRL